ncbi:MAG: translation initiation factor [Gemmataceae bacterium]|nr:translation initiation factor [Gemmataceae bacterium]
MAKAGRKVVLFLDAGAADRGRAAAAEFAAVAGRLGLPWDARVVAVDGTPGVTEADVTTASVLIGCDRGRVDPALAAYPAATVEYWDAAASTGEAVAGLVARLLGGRVVADAPKPVPPPPPKKAHTVRVGRETAGRRGKGVTTVFDLPLTVDQMHELATTLKGKCGTGGTVKDARIEIQGDHRDRIAAVLEEMGYKVKRAGG